MQLVDDEIGSTGWSEPWRHLKIKCQLATGKYSEAMASLEEALRRFPASISLHLLGRDVYRLNGRDQDAAAELDAIDRLIQSGARRYATAEGFVTIGRFFLLRGTDARKVLDQFYDVVTKQQPDYVEAYYATAELALDKEDYALAAETLRKAPKAAEPGPAVSLPARACASPPTIVPEPPRRSPRPSRSTRVMPTVSCLQADQLIDGERYPEAEQVLKQVLDVNPLEARALGISRGAGASSRRQGWRNGRAPVSARAHGRRTPRWTT